MVSERKQRIREMKAICQPEGIMDNSPASDKYIYRNIGFLFTRVFVKTPITPNQITWIWGILMMVFSTLYLLHDWKYDVIAAVGWIIAFSLDNTDGEVARYKNISSKKGLFLDLVNHAITLPYLFFCIGYGQYLISMNPHHIVLGFSAGLGMLLVMTVPELFNSVLTDEERLHRGDSQDIEGGTSVGRDTYKIIRDINPLTFMNVFLVLLAVAIIGWLYYALLFYAIMFPIALVGRVAILYRRLN